MAAINEIVSKEAINGIIDAAKSINELNDSLLGSIDSQEKLNDEFQKTQKSTKSTSEKSSEYSKMLNKAADGQNKLVAAAREMQRQQKALAQTEAKLNAVHSQANIKLQEQRISYLEQSKAIRDKIKAEKENKGSMAAAKTAWSAFGKSVMTGTATVGGFTAAVRATGAAIASVPLVGWIAAAATGLVLMGKSLVNNSKEFSKAASSLSAITGATGKDLDFLKQKAKEISKESTQSATDMLGAFEKIGSAMPALLKNGPLLAEVTKNAVMLSEATGGQLSVTDAANAAAAAMNQFNIPLNESQRAVNVLAAGSLEGSADIVSLSESLRNVGAVANGAGLSLEQTTGALEVLATKQLKGSEAGTALRGVILKLQKEGLGYESGVFNLSDALNEMNGKLATQSSELDKDAMAQRIFGAESITAGKILLSNVDTYEKLTAAVTGTNTAYDQAKVQQDNLTSSNKKFKEAWSNMMLSIEDGGGIFTKIWKGIIDGATAMFNGLSKLIDRFKSKEAKERKEAAKAAKEREIEAKAQLELAEEQKKQEIELTKIITEENKKRKEAEDKAFKERHEKALQAVESAKNLAKLREDIEKSAQKSISDFIIDDEKEMFADMDAEEKQAQKDFEEYQKAKAESSVQLANIQYQQNLLMLKATSKDNEEFARKKFELDKSMVLDSISNLEWSLQTAEISTEKRIELETELAEKKLELNQMVAEDDELKAQQQRERLQSIQDDTIGIINSLFQFRSDMLNNEQTELDQQKEAGLLSEEEYAKKSAEIELKAAKAARAKALFDIAINTAIAVSKVWGQTGVAGILAQVAPIAMGALQAAAVLSAPLPTIPAFADGTHGKFNTPLTFVAGEAGPEVLTKSTGQSYYVDKSTLFSGQQWKGARITSNPELEKMQSISGHSGFNNSSNTQLISEVRELNKTMKNKPTWLIDEKSKQIVGVQQNNSVKRIVNRYRYEA